MSIPNANNKVCGAGAQIRESLKQLKLDDAAVWKREHAREAGPDRIRPPFIIKGAYLALCWFLDVVYANRPLQRFWFLETVARMPYFSYISMLHLYESLGWWRAGAELRKVRFHLISSPDTPFSSQLVP
jgi:ubiquinol oxidase